MQILNTSQIRAADEYTINNEPVSSVDLMERAAKAIAEWFINNFSKCDKLKIIAGPGNNGGDGLALGRLLIENGFDPEIYLMKSDPGYSPDTAVNLERLKALNKGPFIIASEEDFPGISPGDILADALFGTGLSRPVKGLPAQLIDRMNDSGAHIVAVDIPSGIFGDDNRNNSGGSIIRAQNTLTFQFPKLSFMFAENEKYVGRWEVLDIGLLKEFTDSLAVQLHYTDSGIVRQMLKSRGLFSHKGTFGHCLVISGSYGKMGAAVLAATSCLRSGAGLVTVHVPVRGCEIVQTCIPEAMISLDESKTCFSKVPSLENYSAIAAGPATGTEKESQKAIHNLLVSAKKPLVLDADAINIISENKKWIDLIPQYSVLTPHPGEFDRLAGKHGNSHDRLITQIEMAQRHKIIIVLKGGCTSIALPDGSCYFNGSGNPGMATAGSGDVLTGIVLSLLGQGYVPAEAAITGVYLHGVAGDIASSSFSQEAMIAGDIISNLGNAFKQLKE